MNKVWSYKGKEVLTVPFLVDMFDKYLSDRRKCPVISGKGGEQYGQVIVEEPKYISISGDTCTGKTTFAKAILYHKEVQHNFHIPNMFRYFVVCVVTQKSDWGFTEDELRRLKYNGVLFSTTSFSDLPRSLSTFSKVDLLIFDDAVEVNLRHPHWGSMKFDNVYSFIFTGASKASNFELATKIAGPDLGDELYTINLDQF